jgi:hypothetical protein
VLVGLDLGGIGIGDRAPLEVGARVAGVEEGDVGPGEGALGLDRQRVDSFVVEVALGPADDVPEYVREDKL